jgi:hypothetical protein
MLWEFFKSLHDFGSNLAKTVEIENLGGSSTVTGKSEPGTERHGRRRAAVAFGQLPGAPATTSCCFAMAGRLRVFVLALLGRGYKARTAVTVFSFSSAFLITAATAPPLVAASVEPSPATQNAPPHSPHSRAPPRSLVPTATARDAA